MLSGISCRTSQRSNAGVEKAFPRAKITLRGQCRQPILSRKRHCRTHASSEANESKGLDDSSDDDLWSSGSMSTLVESLARAQAKEEFNAMAADIKERQPVDLLDAALLIARHQYPSLEKSEYTGILDEWALGVEKLLEGKERYPLVVLRAISKYLFEDLGLKGNKDDYYNPDNSCINRVIETRKGIPITLSLVYMEVARRVGIEMHGVNMPSHFLLRPAGNEVEVFVDAFNEGQVIFLQDAEELLGSLWNVEVKLDPVWIQRNEPLPSDRFVGRMLRNLKLAYTYDRKPSSILAIIDYLRALGQGKPEDNRDEGMCYFALKRFAESAQALQAYLDEEQDLEPEAREKIRFIIDKAYESMGRKPVDDEM